MRILGISGSLRCDSHNTALLRAAAELLPPGVELELWDGLRDVPPYDQDDDVEPAPPAVAALRAAVAGADAVLIATPEYNSSIPGALKNALDWASRPFATNAFRNKPVAVIGSSAGVFGAVWAQAELRKVLGRDGRPRRRDRGRGRPRRTRSSTPTAGSSTTRCASSFATRSRPCAPRRRRSSSRPERDFVAKRPMCTPGPARLWPTAFSDEPYSAPARAAARPRRGGAARPRARARRRACLSSTTGTRSRSRSSSSANASASGMAESIVAFGCSAISRSGVVRGSRPRATTSRTSVLRVTTPASRPSSVTSTARTSSGASASPASCARRRGVERERLGDHRVADELAAPSRVDARAPRARRRPRGCRRRAPRRAARGRRSSASSQTRSNASPSLSASRRRISSRSQKRRLRSCTHSKYETVTPPAFVSTSGRTGMPRSARIASAATDVGPFAPSATSRQRSRAGVLGGHLVLARGEHEHVAVELEQLRVRDALAPGKPSSEPCSRDVLVRASARRGRPRRTMPPDDVRDARPRSRPARASSVAAIAADVAEALDDAAQPGELPAEPLAGALDHHHDAGAGRLVAEDRAADRDRLAGHDLGHRVALLHRVRVHHPRHRLLVRGHVRRGDVRLRPDERRELGGEAARDARELAAARAAAGCSARRPSRRRTAAAAARTSRSSTSRAPRTRRG